MKRKEPEPIHVDTLDQKLLYDILGELQEQRRTIKSMNTAVQLIGVIMLLSVIGGCLFALFGSALF